jgi:NADH oxidase (H2O2-forming)
MMPGASKVRVRIAADVRDLRIIGGQVINTLPAADKINIITLAIKERLTLKGLSKLNYSAQP